ncbi:RagB/SusD family nutrient uptake outer membrane protein [Niabella aurantiaca]|uniref:RagB/SusD family nutrient uptake outer membrane protein n=1 Tax=Niabella aurantiaca TaxID=379900 RepID=UPI00037B8664|nr:RagB/SusD family nutrient uptake outer membrane protein [Niabella aurantiaca]
MQAQNIETKKIPLLKKATCCGLFFVLILFISCKKQLEENTYSVFSGEVVFSDVDGAKAATLGVYEAMTSRNGGYGHYLSIMSDIDNDLSKIEGAGFSGDQRTLGHYNFDAQHSMVTGMWNTLWNGINRANIVIDRIPEMDLFTNGTAAQKTDLNRLLGEVKFLRGFYYSELVRLWGDVPIRLVPSASGNLNVKRDPAAQVYEQIFKDMSEAAELLPAAMPVDERVNKWAVKAMLARVYVFAGGYALRMDGTINRPANYREYYTKAKALIDEIVAANVYKLNPDYAQVFKNQCQHVLEPTENIFQVALFGVSSGNSEIGNYNVPATVTGKYFRGNTFIYTTPLFYQSFDSLDLRQDFAVATYRIDSAGDRQPISVTGSTNQQIYPGKWSREWQTNAANEKGQTNINFVIMRYSDLLLLRAEVENELNGGPNAIALDAINQVRRRAYGLGLDIKNRVRVYLTSGGAGYTSGAASWPAIEINGGSGSGAKAAVTSVATSGGVTRLSGIQSTYTGAGYTSEPTVTIAAPWDTMAVPQWQPNTNYVADALVSYGNNLYTVTTAGISTNTPPTNTTGASPAATGAIFTFSKARATAIARLLPQLTQSEIDLGSGMSKEIFLDAIKQERAWELCFEGLRKADLIRWGNPADGTSVKQVLMETENALKAMRGNFPYIAGTTFITFKHELYPIPQSEVDASGMAKNPNW